MSTRSIIAKQNEDGTIDNVYCHWDGYPSHNGSILRDYYNTPEKIDELLSHGSMSSLAERCDKPKGHSFDNSVEGYTVYYGRDRGMRKTLKRTVNSEKELLDRDCWQEFVYLFKNGKWYYSDHDSKFKVLTKKACQE